MSKHILKDNYERMFGQMKEDWWDDMDSSAQASYIKAHPGSKQAQQADDGGGDEEPKGKRSDRYADVDTSWMDDPDAAAAQGSPGYTTSDDDNWADKFSAFSSDEPSDEEELDPQKIKDDYATAGENLTFSKGELDDAKAMGDEEEISRMQSIVDNDRKEFVASRKTYYTANQEKIEDDYDTAEENMNFSRGELEDAKEMGDEEEISRIQSTVDDDRKEFRKSRRELGRMEKAVGAKSPRTGNELNQETLMIGGKQYRRISEGVEKQPKPKYEFSEFYKRFKK